MKRICVLLAFIGLLTACHHGENRGAPGTETGTYQGTGSSDTMTNTDNVIIPQNPNY